MAAPSSPIVQRITRLLGHPSARSSGHTAVRVAFAVFALGAVTWLIPGVGYAAPSRADAQPTKLALAEAGEGVRFVDSSDSNRDRSTLHLDTGGERVEVHVEAPKAAPVIVEEIIEPPEPPRGDSLQIIIQGGFHGPGFPFCGNCGGGWYLGLEMMEGMSGLEALIGGALEEELEEELEDLFDGDVDFSLHGWQGHHSRGHHARAERIRERAERAREHAERARQHAERAAEHARHAADRGVVEL